MKKSKFLLLILSLLICFICFTPGIYAITYNSGVLEDLNNDKNFVANDYKSYTKEEIDLRNNDKFDDNDIQFVSMITMAESDTKELFVYVYNPTIDTLKLKVNKVSLSSEKRKGYEAVGIKIYELELMNQDGVFQKYKVKNYIISSEADRYYNFIALYRDPIYGEKKDQTVVNMVAENVGLQFVFYKLNGQYMSECLKFETLDIDVIHNDYFIANKGFKIGNLTIPTSYGHHNRCFYIVFDIKNYEVDYIIDADLSFTVVKSILNGYDKEYEYKDITLNEVDEVTISKKGLFVSKSSYQWNRILRANDFYESLSNQGINFNKDLIDVFSSNYHVFSYFERESPNEEKLVEILTEDVSILRIHFVSDGEHYNLGVVGDITSPDNVPGGDDGTSIEDLKKQLKELMDTFIKVLGVLLLVIIVTCCIPLLNFLFNGFYELIKLPGRLYKILFGKKRK